MAKRKKVNADLLRVAKSITDKDIRGCTSRHLAEQEEMISACAGRADATGDDGLAETMWSLADRYSAEIERRAGPMRRRGN